jgi:hypothetical protein
MRLPRMTIRRWMVLVAVVGIGSAALCRLTPWRESPKCQSFPRPAGRICVDLFPIDPPPLSRFADPYDPDSPPPAAMRAER